MDLLKSKKFRAALIAMVGVIVGHFKPDFQPMAEQIMFIMMAFITGQGLADFGKSKAEIEVID